VKKEKKIQGHIKAVLPNTNAVMFCLLIIFAYTILLTTHQQKHLCYVFCISTTLCVYILEAFPKYWLLSSSLFWRLP